MIIDEFGIEQPNDDKILLRYMDKWKFDSLCKNGIVFTRADNQSDKDDCINTCEETGFTLRENYIRKYRFLSCWTIDKKISEKKLFQYCNFKNKDKIMECNLAYAIVSNYKKLMDFICLKTINEMIFSTIQATYNVRSGIVEYTDGEIESPFKKKLEFKSENEFRLFLDRGTSSNVYSETVRTHIPETDYCPSFEWMQGNPRDFLTDVYEYNKNTGEFHQIGIPYVTRKTVEPRLFTSHRIY